MNQIVYYKAVSIDRFIAGLNEDISGFVVESAGVNQYKADLLQFATIIMGRKTYEFGDNYGLTPGQPAYPQMTYRIQYSS